MELLRRGRTTEERKVIVGIVKYLYCGYSQGMSGPRMKRNGFWVLTRELRNPNPHNEDDGKWVLGIFSSRTVALKWMVPLMRGESLWIRRPWKQQPGDSVLAWLRTMEEHIQRENFEAAFGLMQKHLWPHCRYTWELRAAPYYEEKSDGTIGQ